VTGSNANSHGLRRAQIGIEKRLRIMNKILRVPEPRTTPMYLRLPVVLVALFLMGFGWRVLVSGISFFEVVQKPQFLGYFVGSAIVPVGLAAVVAIPWRILELLSRPSSSPILAAATIWSCAELVIAFTR
jgi:hypothetical protein